MKTYVNRLDNECVITEIERLGKKGELYSCKIVKGTTGLEGVTFKILKENFIKDWKPKTD